MPVDSWGTEALALSFAGRLNGDLYRVLAADDDTTVTITTTNGIIVTNLAAGTAFETNLDGPLTFQANQPIQVAQFANGTTFDNPLNTEGDPCEILLSPTGHYLQTNVVFSLNEPDAYGNPNLLDEHYLNLIIPQSAVTNTLVDGLIIDSTNFVPIGTSGYYGAQISVESGSHTVTSSEPIGVEVYGWGFEDSYSYFGGIVK